MDNYYAVDVPAYVSTPDTSASAFGRLREVSATGGFVDTRLEVQPPSHVTVQLLTDRPPASLPLVMHAEVIRVDLLGIYLEWTEQAPDLVGQLTKPRAARDTMPLVEGRAASFLRRVSVDDWSAD